MTSVPPALPNGAFQRGYVTTDLDRAMTMFAADFGVVDFKVLREFELAVATPAGPARLVQDLAFAWVGDLMLELIRPIVEVGTFYSGALTDGALVAPHHVSTSLAGDLDAWVRHRAAVGRSSPAIVEGGIGDVVRFAFFDMRSAFGVYLEAAWHGAAGEGLPRGVPCFPSPSPELLAFWANPV